MDIANKKLRTTPPKSIQCKDEYEREKEYVIKKAKVLATSLKGINFDVLKYRDIFIRFVDTCKRDFNTEVRDKSTMSDKDPLDNKDYYDYIKSKFDYEYSREDLFTLDPDVDYEELYRRSSGGSYFYSDTARIRMSVTFFYFKVVLDFTNAIFGRNIRSNRVAIYDIANKDLVDVVSKYDFDFWVDKDFTHFSKFLKPIAIKMVSDENYLDIYEESKKYFNNDIMTTSLAEMFAGYLINKNKMSNQEKDTKKCQD